MLKKQSLLDHISHTKPKKEETSETTEIEEISEEKFEGKYVEKIKKETYVPTSEISFVLNKLYEDVDLSEVDDTTSTFTTQQPVKTEHGFIVQPEYTKSEKQYYFEPEPKKEETSILLSQKKFLYSQSESIPETYYDFNGSIIYGPYYGQMGQPLFYDQTGAPVQGPIYNTKGEILYYTFMMPYSLPYLGKEKYFDSKGKQVFGPFYDPFGQITFYNIKGKQVQDTIYNQAGEIVLVNRSSDSHS